MNDKAKKPHEDKDAQMVKKLTLIRKNLDAHRGKKKKTKS